MKSWLSKFKISAAHDDGRALPSALNQTIADSEDLRRFAESTRAVEHALRQTQPQVTAPPSLHRSIMRAVETAAQPVRSPRWPHLVRWLAAPGFAVVLAVALWPHTKPAAPASDPAPLASLSTTLELGSTMSQTLPPTLVSPLSDELDRLNHDLTNTAQFLISSLPTSP